MNGMTGEGRPRRSRPRAWVPRFLEAMRATGNVRLSADAAGVDRTTPYRLAQRDPSFQAAWAEAEQDAIDVLEATARQRALSSSDQLLMFLLRGLRPERYGSAVDVRLELPRRRRASRAEARGVRRGAPRAGESQGRGTVQMSRPRRRGRQGPLSLPQQQLLLAVVAMEIEAEQRRAGLDPVAWVIERLGEELWSKQRDIAQAVAAFRRVAVPSCHGVGKSFIASRLAAWWIDTHPAGSAFAISTAPTFQQVRAILWREIGRAHAKGNLAGHVNQTEWWVNGELVAFGRKPADTEPAAFQGIHARHVLVILDEAAGIAKPLWDAAISLTANEESRILAIGNPDDPGSYFATVCAPDSGWRVIGIDAFASPNFTGEPVSDELRALLVSPIWAEERAAEWGAESPLYLAKVRGQFPDAVSDAVVPLSWVRACQRDPLDPLLERAWAERTPGRASASTWVLAATRPSSSPDRAPGPSACGGVTRPTPCASSARSCGPFGPAARPG